MEGWEGASRGYVDRLKKRFRIKAKKICGESLDCADVTEYLNEELPGILALYAESDILSADEFAFFFQQIPDKTHCYYDEAPAGHKRQSARLTGLVIASMDGKERIVPWVLGKVQCPRRLKTVHKIKPQQLLCKYSATGKGWMTQEQWNEIMLWLNNYMRAKGRKVLLIVDNAPVHDKGITNLSNVRIEYLPPNTTSQIQPCDQGIILSLKCKAKARLARHYIRGLDMNPPITYKKFIQECDLMRACTILYVEWRFMPDSIIVNSFKRAGWYAARNLGIARANKQVGTPVTEKDVATDPPPMHQTEEDRRTFAQIADLAGVPPEKRSDTAIRQFVESEGDVEMYPPMTVDDIVEAVVNPEHDDGDDVIVDEDAVEIPFVKSSEAVEYITKLMYYAERNDFAAKHIYHMQLLQDEIFKAAEHAKTQSTLETFFDPRSANQPGHQIPDSTTPGSSDSILLTHATQVTPAVRSAHSISNVSSDGDGSRSDVGPKKTPTKRAFKHFTPISAFLQKKQPPVTPTKTPVHFTPGKASTPKKRPHSVLNKPPAPSRPPAVPAPRASTSGEGPAKKRKMSVALPPGKGKKRFSAGDIAQVAVAWSDFASSENDTSKDSNL